MEILKISIESHSSTFQCLLCKRATSRCSFVEVVNSARTWPMAPSRTTSIAWRRSVHILFFVMHIVPRSYWFTHRKSCNFYFIRGAHSKRTHRYIPAQRMCCKPIGREGNEKYNRALSLIILHDCIVEKGREVDGLLEFGVVVLAAGRPQGYKSHLLIGQWGSIRMSRQYGGQRCWSSIRQVRRISIGQMIGWCIAIGHRWDVDEIDQDEMQDRSARCSKRLCISLEVIR